MFDRLIEFFLNPPSRLRSLGRMLCIIGAGLTVLGLYSEMGTSMVDMTRGLAHIQAAPSSLAEMFPTIPTWFIPEGPFGFTVTVTLFVIGVVCQLQAKTIQRMWDAA